ncbi:MULTISPECIES: succinate dehydrogenase cytochrome b subunit [unclassified Streptomyces]|uniref:succinate dehydrogenase cytochrome b subunit n=1 Tax=unclassified Streptomyces TaxID=2593676 RepID=UPI001660B115|nr:MULTISPECIES: succinate dehydrogenase cytochrome b subunit [unclassified Streptomyces]MBD0707026.1 succinate dehydrogenase [Streptomyces sp. CBMA291]MBD0714283.1 succinate dehydrogenase [Streptomyces sp. CBMA370]
MALAPTRDRTTRRPPSPTPSRGFFSSTIGKKTVMAVSGLIMLGYLVAHLFGNLKIFFGPEEINEYAHWLRVVGAPFFHREWILWAARVLLLAAVVAHGVSAYQLSRRDLKARPTGYAHRRKRASYATRTMRWGGIILALFIVWHILDLTTGTVHSGGFEAEKPYQNIIDTFSTWYGNVIYLVAMLAVGLHIRHGFWSAAQTLGVGSARRDRILKIIANGLALVLTAGFVSIPVAVMTGLVS